MLSGGSFPSPSQMTEPSQPSKEAHFWCLYLWSYHFCHYPQITKGDGMNIQCSEKWSFSWSLMFLHICHIVSDHQTNSLITAGAVTKPFLKCWYSSDSLWELLSRNLKKMEQWWTFLVVTGLSKFLQELIHITCRPQKNPEIHLKNSRPQSPQLKLMFMIHQ